MSLRSSPSCAVGSSLLGTSLARPRPGALTPLIVVEPRVSPRDPFTRSGTAHHVRCWGRETTLPASPAVSDAIVSGHSRSSNQSIHENHQRESNESCSGDGDNSPCRALTWL